MNHACSFDDPFPFPFPFPFPPPFPFLPFTVAQSRHLDKVMKTTRYVLCHYHVTVTICYAICISSVTFNFRICVVGDCGREVIPAGALG